MHASVCAHAKVNPPLQFISVLQVCLSKPFLNLQLSSSSSPSVCCSTPPPLLFLCERSLGTEPSRVCFLNEYLIRLMRLAGGGASQWSTEREKEGRREGGRKGKEAETQNAGDREATRQRERSGGVVALHNSHRSRLAHRSWCDLQQWGTSSSSHCRGSTTSKPKPTERRGGAGATTAQAPGEESGTNRRSRKRSPRKHVSNTHKH